MKQTVIALALLFFAACGTPDFTDADRSECANEDPSMFAWCMMLKVPKSDAERRRDWWVLYICLSCADETTQCYTQPWDVATIDPVAENMVPEVREALAPHTTQ